MNKSEGFQHERMVQILQMVVGWNMEYEWDEGNNGERLNFDKGDQDDRGELANQVLLVVFLVCNVQGFYTVWYPIQSINVDKEKGET